ncbi:nuclear transport factor 2 family protein [Paenibacillus apiarius]|uniref:Nuclear transport factor 2 family protein n=1 Tax=Paenibacillus apiarius TaxID=46240 RepID=A0ABT4DWC4_9BACL|nr:nuclear transport factor 2 family protein [Paenibacillus apiarius]MCY9517686.1 nuclear transport factor 2 family protein [Paenibacillus apiarius]MCY9521661.1 nuclear transport factor 2 family protein [Paenibacillus apiarius]MCY9555339.1 nuclear transport factor 2 family protein [Paenibacillus apiarius]MCY9561219.1 nuclear transport factor 2 family protein [Paenibacillus apiarius]MCY9686362.1 nuclear transport factor 2 family protein [Paenibacillus apiarius]
MNQRTNLDIVRSTYEGPSSDNARHLLEALSEQVVWTEAAGFPYGGTYIGPEAIMAHVFSRLASEWINYKASVRSYHEVKDKGIIIAEGVYSGTYKKTGKAFEADFVHVWELDNGKIIKFKQYVDSHVVQNAMTI